MSATRKEIFWLVSLLTLAPLPVLAAKASVPSKTVSVDCSKGQTITEALATNAEQITVEVSGFCNEHVVIRRRGVTLRGSDPALDGVDGTGLPSSTAGAVEVLDINVHLGGEHPAAVILESLTVRNGPNSGVKVTDAFVELTGCEVIDNGRVGLLVNHASSVIGTGDLFAHNGWDGAQVSDGSQFFCTGCAFRDNASRGVVANYHGEAFLTDCQIADNASWGMAVQFGGTAGVESCTITGPFGVTARYGGWIDGWGDVTANLGVALDASDGGEVIWEGGDLTGPLRASWPRAILWLAGAQQISNPGVNVVADGSWLRVEASTLLGDTTIGTLGQAQLLAGSTVGNLLCSSGGEAVCDGSVSKTSSTCGLCP